MSQSGWGSWHLDLLSSSLTLCSSFFESVDELMKRSYSSESEQSFVTADCQIEDGHEPASLRRSVSPPPKRLNVDRGKVAASKTDEGKLSTAAVEAGEAAVEDHVNFFSHKLLAAQRPIAPGQSRIPHEEWLGLYARNLNDQGHHFVVHQHDHPVAGTHYDLRLQCNATSSISFAIMYGLPGDPNSRRLNRNATETRVHNLWNHLIETASGDTGTMLLWDTGEYEVLAYRSSSKQSTASESGSSVGPESSFSRNSVFERLSEPAKLAVAFSRRKVRLRLRGTRLPIGYTISLRLTKENFRSSQPSSPAFRRKRNTKAGIRRSSPGTTSDSVRSSDDERPPDRQKLKQSLSSLSRTASPPTRKRDEGLDGHVSGDETEKIRLTNAYPGATNSIGSIHQRKWYLSMDRSSSGFKLIPTPGHVEGHHSRTWWTRWKEGDDGAMEGFERFHVLGREDERSIVTGRLARDILGDEGVKGYIPRGRWRAVIE